VDRKNLPVPEIQSSRRETAYVEPGSEIEQKIAAVWREVLALEKVGLHDSFFDLGGNSFLMVQAYTKLRKILARDISIVEMFFQYPTIHALAEFLVQTQGGTTGANIDSNTGAPIFGDKSLESEKSSDQQQRRINSRKTLVQQQRKVRLSQRVAERDEEDV
jgi:hypothetical protein